MPGQVWQDSMGLLGSEEPLDRLRGVSGLRALLENVEQRAVTAARSSGNRRSWDDIARALGTTRWTVLRHFGPSGSQPVADGDLAPGEVAAAPGAGSEAADWQRIEGRLPAEVTEKLVAFTGELVASGVLSGPLDATKPLAVRVQMLPGRLRVELSDTPVDSAAFMPRRPMAGSGFADASLASAEPVRGTPVSVKPGEE